MASIFAIRDGVKDARAGKPAYFWNVVTQPAERKELLREAWHRVLRVMIIGVVMEVLYEIIVFHAIRPLQLVVIVLGLAFVPYLLVRGPVNRIARRLIRRGTQRKKAA
jgi:predicted thioredoxin/glutaredoxin